MTEKIVYKVYRLSYMFDQCLGNFKNRKSKVEMLRRTFLSKILLPSQLLWTDIFL